MNPTAEAYAAARRPLTAVLDAVPPQGWALPSPCAGWSARDVVAHLVETQRELFAGREVDLGPAPDVDADPAAAWRAHAQRVADVIADDAVADTAFDGYFGPTTLGATLERFYVFDMLVHRWDVATAVGPSPDLPGTALTDAELDRIDAAATSFGEGLYMDGVCRAGVEAPADSGRQAQVLARLGRQV